MAWAVLQRCQSQVRMGGMGPIGLDYGAILRVARAMGGPEDLVAELLPIVEAAFIAGLSGTPLNTGE